MSDRCATECRPNMDSRSACRLAIIFLALQFPSTGFGEEFAADIRARFTPREPAVSLTYRVSYRVMGLEITQIAVAKVGVTVGLWR